MKFLLLSAIIVYLHAPVIIAAEADAIAFAKNKRQAAEDYAKNTKTYAGDKNVLVLPGLVADRKARKVTLSGVFNPLEENASVEFLVVSEKSENDYETLVRAFVLAADVKKALSFIGVEPGRPYDPSQFKFWPRGPRLVVHFEWDQVGEEGASRAFRERAESLVYNTDTKKTVDPNGYVYTGSIEVDDPQTGKKVLSADLYDPFVIVGLFNSQAVLMDVPYMALQNDVYSTHVPNPKLMPAKGTSLKIVLEPEYPAGKTREVDVSVKVTPGSVANAVDIRTLNYVVTVADEEPETKTLEGVLGVLARLNADGRDPFLSFELDDSLAVSSLHDLYSVIHDLAMNRKLGVEPPLDEHLFYRAYIPTEKWRDRTKRVTQPLEVRLKSDGGVVSGMVVHIEQKWVKDSIRPTLSVTEIPVSSAKELVTRLEEINNQIPVLLVFAQGRVTRAELLSFLTPAMAVTPTVHVYVDP